MKYTWQMIVSALAVLAFFIFLAVEFVSSFERRSVEYVPAAGVQQQFQNAAKPVRSPDGDTGKAVRRSAAFSIPDRPFPDSTTVEHLTETQFTVYCGTHEEVAADMAGAGMQGVVRGENYDGDGYLFGVSDKKGAFAVYLVYPDKVCLLEVTLNPVWTLENIQDGVAEGDPL